MVKHKKTRTSQKKLCFYTNVTLTSHFLPYLLGKINETKPVPSVGCQILKHMQVESKDKCAARVYVYSIVINQI